MLDRFLAALSIFVTQRRVLVLSVIAVLTVICAAALPRLRTESSPENFVISFGGYEERVRHFREHFGDTDNVMMLLVEAEDATSLEALQYQHALARRFAQEPEVLRVDGLTVTPMPRASSAPSGDAGLLDTLDDAGSLDDLDSLEAGDAADASAATSADHEAEAALATLVQSAPERFPLGLMTVAERVTEADREPIVHGDMVTAADVETIRGAIAESPIVVGNLVSHDRTLGAVVVRLRAELGTGNERVDFVNRMDAWLDMSAPPSGVRLHRAGLPHLRTSIVRYMMRDQLVLIPLTILVCVVLLYLSFRWIPGTYLPLVAVGVCVVWIVGAMAMVGEPMTIITNVLPTLIIIIELSNAVHLITRWEEELRRMRKPDRVEAAARALRTMAAACFLTSFTSAVGLGSLLVSQTEMLRRFGLLAALGTMLAYCVTIFVIPAALPFFQPPGQLAATSEDQNKPKFEPAGFIERSMVHGTRMLLRRPWTVLALTVLLVAPTFLLANRVQVDTALLDTFQADDPVVIATRLMDERMDGIRPLEVMLTVRDGEAQRRLDDPEVIAAIDDFERWTATQDGVLRASTFTDYLHTSWARIAGFGRDASGRLDGTDLRELPIATRTQVDALHVLFGRIDPNPLAYYLSDDRRFAHVELRIGDVGARRTGDIIDGVQAEAERRFGALGIDVSLTGEAFIGSRGIDSVVQDLVGSLGLSVVLIFATLVMLFRSVRYAAIALPPNVLPLVTTMAWMVIRGIPLNAGTAIVFSIAVGVGVDGTIHALARFREEDALGLGRSAAIVRTARGTGRAIVISALTLMLGFAVLLTSSFVPIRNFGELIASAMTASLFSTLILQPVLVKLFGGPVVKRAVPRSAH